ncbi:MAG TPA: hypothetical protein PK771_11930 [Spirochaetota bacterium]|nr:hypothetical protein [Spirochaetota bacterium]
MLKRVFLFIFIILALLNCRKDQKNIVDESNSEVEKPKIDFDAMKELIARSSNIDMDVFFAISVCHREYISRYQAEADKLDEEKQKAFYLQKKIEFFNSIKYTEEQYNEFMEKNINQMNDYINNHPDISEYLISTN